MKILVIDDDPTHRAAAEAQLKDHDATVVGSYDEGFKLLSHENSFIPFECKFEAVLVDLLMPASAKAQGSKGKQFVGQEMPVGIFLALLAARNGAKYVAVFTDLSHHDHPASACIDPFCYSWKPPMFMVEDAKMLLSNEDKFIGRFFREDLSKEMSSEEYGQDFEKAQQITVRTKNWQAMLNRLLNE